MTTTQESTQRISYAVFYYGDFIDSFENLIDVPDLDWTETFNFVIKLTFVNEKCISRELLNLF